MQSFFLSPLVSKDYCSWWSALVLVNLVLIVLIILGFLFTLFSKNKDVQKQSIPMLYSVIALFFSYFQSRILYGMCVKSLK